MRAAYESAMAVDGVGGAVASDAIARAAGWELARELEMDQRQVERLMRVSLQPTSLDAPLAEANPSVGCSRSAIG